MAQEQCRLDGCELPGTLRGGFCTEAHRDENKRAGWRRRKQKQRAADSVEHVAASDGRSYPGVNVSNEIWQRTENHPSRNFARRQEEPEIVDYVTRADTRTSADAGIPMGQRVLPASQLQRYTPPRVEQENWAPSEDTTSSEPYRHDAVFENNWETTWERSRGPAYSGNPQAFYVRRASR